jgi:hypothetical protein
LAKSFISPSPARRLKIEATFACGPARLAPSGLIRQS